MSLIKGLYKPPARLYNADLGRFLQRDPVGYIDGTSLYVAYVHPTGTDPLGLRVFYIRLEIDRASKPASFNTPNVSRKLNSYLANSCNRFLAKGDRIAFVLSEVGSRKKADEGWHYRTYAVTRRVPWRGWVNPGMWVVAPVTLVRDGVVSTFRKPVFYTQWVHFTNTGAFPAATGGTDTSVNKERFKQDMGARGLEIRKGNWDIAWANMLTHEVLWHGALGKGDRPMTGKDNYVGGTGVISGRTPIVISARFCCRLIKKLDLRKAQKLVDAAIAKEVAAEKAERKKAREQQRKALDERLGREKTQ